MRAHPEGGWIVELNSRHPAAGTGQQPLPCANQPGGAQQGRTGLPDRPAAGGELAGQVAAPAGDDDPQGRQPRSSRQQDGFFRRGVQSLRPLILRDIAEAIGMHESTVSRVTSNKHMATPRGLYRAQIFLHLVDPRLERRRGAFGRGGAPPIRGLIDREPAAATLVGRAHRRAVAARRRRYRPAHGRQIPRGDAHPVLGAAPPRKAAGAVAGRHIAGRASPRGVDAGSGRRLAYGA